MNLQQVMDDYHAALDEFARGDSEPVKLIFSHREDVVLANPFGPAVRGWKQVSQALDYAASNFSDGRMNEFNQVARYETDHLVTIFETEQWKARVGGRENVTSFSLRVTTTFRREDDAWAIVHRHADPIATHDSRGPLRQMSA